MTDVIINIDPKAIIVKIFVVIPASTTLNLFLINKSATKSEPKNNMVNTNMIPKSEIIPIILLYFFQKWSALLFLIRSVKIGIKRTEGPEMIREQIPIIILEDKLIAERFPVPVLIAQIASLIAWKEKQEVARIDPKILK